MNDFKAGDRVEYVGADRTTITRSLLGKTGKVAEIKSERSIRVDWDESTLKHGVLGTNLRLIAPDVLTIPRAELPEVVERDGALWAIGLQYGLGFPAAKHRARALAQLAVSEFLATREKAEQEAADQHAQILNKRRDELARELFDQIEYKLHPEPFNYQDATPVVRAAIDRIIQLEGQVKK